MTGGRYLANFDFLPRSGTTVTLVGVMADVEIGLGPLESFLGFFTSLLVRC